MTAFRSQLIKQFRLLKYSWRFSAYHALFSLAERRATRPHRRHHGVTTYFVITLTHSYSRHRADAFRFTMLVTRFDARSGTRAAFTHYRGHQPRAKLKPGPRIVIGHKDAEACHASHCDERPICDMAMPRISQLAAASAYYSRLLSLQPVAGTGSC